MDTYFYQVSYKWAAAAAVVFFSTWFSFLESFLVFFFHKNENSLIFIEDVVAANGILN